MSEAKVPDYDTCGLFHRLHCIKTLASRPVLICKSYYFFARKEAAGILSYSQFRFFVYFTFLFKLFFWFTFSCYFIVIVFQNRIILIRFCILLMWLQSCCTQIVPRIAYKPKLVFTLLNNTPAFIRFL